MRNFHHNTLLTIFLLSWTMLLCCGELYAQQNIKQFVKTQIIPISTIDPDSTDFKDMDVIGTAIGNSKIVMLGEQDHGDAPTFLAKTRIIKYLHEKKGFNVLVFESDFFGLNYGWEQLPKSKATISRFVSENVFAIWSACTACGNLFQNYIPESFNTQSPLQLSGIDDQLFEVYSVKHLMIGFDSVIRKLELPVTRQSNYLTEIFPMLDTVFKFLKLPKDTALFDKRNVFLTQIRDQLSLKVDKDNYWLLIADNLIAENYQFKYKNTDYWKYNNARDQQMAMNLKWLSQIKYKNEKIIVWAHNYHISKYNGHFPEKFMNQAISMGNVFTADTAMANNTYILGFTSLEGTAGRITTPVYKLETQKPNSFETWVNPDYKYAFLDFRKYNQENNKNIESFYMAGSVKTPGLHTVHQAQWTKVFDGVFYIKEMYPCVMIQTTIPN